MFDLSLNHSPTVSLIHGMTLTRHHPLVPLPPISHLSWRVVAVLVEVEDGRTLGRRYLGGSDSSGVPPVKRVVLRLSERVLTRRPLTVR